VTASSTWSPVRSRRTTRRQTLTLGFVPLEVFVVNETDVITWVQDRPAWPRRTASSRWQPGTMTLDTGSAIVINTDGTVTLSATLCGNAKAIKFIARRG
jgi:hypothetical protein